MQSFYTLLDGKASAGVRAMIEGLREARSMEGFELNMATFGSFKVNGGICVGCAATTTVMKVANLKFRPHEIGTSASRADAVETSIHDLGRFEASIDALRQGELRRFLTYFLDLQSSEGTDTAWNLKDAWELERPALLPELYEDFTEAHLASYEILASWLEARGF
jgi:hypothetical protein